MVEVLIFNISTASYDLDSLFSKLDPARQKKAKAYVKEEDRIRSIIGSTLIERFAKPGRLSYNEQGKPYGENGFFNLSHSGDIVALALCEEEVGIDVEKMDPQRAEGLSRYIFKEDLTLDQFYARWTRIEAVGKCLGIGAAEFRKLPFTEGEVSFEGADLFTMTQEKDGYMYSLAVRSFIKPEVTVRHLHSL